MDTKLKSVKKIINALHPEAKLPDPCIIWEGHLIDMDDNLIKTLAIITPDGLHSVERRSDGSIINLKGLEAKNKGNVIFNEDAVKKLYRTYGFIQKAQVT